MTVLYDLQKNEVQITATSYKTSGEYELHKALELLKELSIIDREATWKTTSKKLSW